MLYERVKTLTERRGMTVKDLEIELGLGNGTLGKWRTVQPNMNTLLKVANFFGISLSELVEE